MDVNDFLLENLKTGFIDKEYRSEGDSIPALIYNDKHEGKKVLTTLIKELEGCNEFWFSVAFITTSGIATLMNTLIELEGKGIKGKILASQYLNFTQPEALRKIRKLSNVELKISATGNFHSKGYLFEKDGIYNLIIGSSNLTASALKINKEWNLKVSATESSVLGIQVIKEFEKEFALGIHVDDEYLKYYAEVWKAKIQFDNNVNKQFSKAQKVTPNQMQIDALENIAKIRKEGKRKALLISATGTGKTYLSAFDVERVKPKRFLFVVHRKIIALKALETFKNILGEQVSMGLYSSSDLDKDAEYIFATVQTISRDKHLEQFKKDHFDYIVIDETHRAAAKSYKRIMNYFEPNFLLGMTATPERTDGENIFELFNYNIAYKIRLHDALEEQMISPFHYYGVTDLIMNGKTIDNKSVFNTLVQDERVSHIIDKIQLYGCDNGNIKGLVFCSSNEESNKLSKAFNHRAYRTVALSANSSEKERETAIESLEEGTIDYIFTRDIFNEGVDIPCVNQVIMLRPTQSAIVFVQQLGRGLRKANNKEYLTVIDFIGNYDRNYLIPIALYGDKSYNKDRLRRFLSKGSSLIPGSSTVNFDKISKERIFDAINSSNMQLKRDLDESYRLLKYELGRIPKMIDFLEKGSRDPYHFVSYSKSYYNYVCKIEGLTENRLAEKAVKLLELFSIEINNAKRIEESLILKELIEIGTLNIEDFKSLLLSKYQYDVSDQTINSCILNLNFEFTTEKYKGKQESPNKIYGYKLVECDDDILTLTPYFREVLTNRDFKTFLMDNIDYAIRMYDQGFNPKNHILGFNLYNKYTRKDAFRILNNFKNPIAQNVGGYKMTDDKLGCPIFVNYEKEEGISNATKYEDEFVDPQTFDWMSKNKRSLKSPDVLAIRNKKGLRLPLFIKKSNDEGLEFYYMGELTPVDDRFIETKIPDDNDKMVSVVKVRFKLNQPVADDIYQYITQ